MWKYTYTELMLVWEELAELDHPGSSMRERRIELGWTQAELAKRTGVPQADISRIENGHLDARWSTLQRLLAALAGAGAPRRSRANGRRVTATPQPSKKWKQPESVAPIRHTKK